MKQTLLVYKLDYYQLSIIIVLNSMKALPGCENAMCRFSVAVVQCFMFLPCTTDLLDHDTWP